MEENVKIAGHFISIVTIALTGFFIGLATTGAIPQEVMTVYTTVIAFYFGTQATKE